MSHLFKGKSAGIRQQRGNVKVVQFGITSTCPEACIFRVSYEHRI